MPGTTITGSPNISLFDSKIVGDVCNAQFIIDASPSVFIGSGASNVLGVRVKITNPYGVVIKDYSPSYDIPAPLTATYTRAIPTQATKVQYGNYEITLQLTDSNSDVYYVTKTINVCTYNEATNPCDDRVRLIANCKNGRLTVSLSEPPVFKGFYALSRSQTIVVNFPTASAASAITTSNGSFSVQLFEGVYKVVVTVCATYNLTDNVFLRLGYAGTFEKNVKCLLDYTCIYPRIKQLNDKIKEDCSQAERDTNASVVLDALRLLKSAELANDAGEDASDYIADLEKLLGCECTCECNGLPISNNAPSTNVLIEGCSVSKETVGLTDIYTIDASEFILEVDPTQNVITVSAPSLTTCISMQRVYFSIANAYAGIKTQINTLTEYNFWAGIIRLALAGLDVTCLTAPTTTLLQLMQSMINKACEGGSCQAEIENVQVVSASCGGLDSVTGNCVSVSWDVVANVFGVHIFMDGVLQGTVLSSITSFLITNANDGNTHEYTVLPFCANGNGGTSVNGTFNFLGCPTVTPPVVSSNNINGVECPFDLEGIVSAPPVGIETEWHTGNNTLAASLVPDPTAVSSGVYYAFSKDADGCYSTATVVTLICDGETSCTAPQSLEVTEVSGDFRVTFNSASFPPPLDSYTVKRRLASAPDVDGSYTTIGTPTYNTFLSKWVITDATGADNTLYVYKAISNCGGSPGTTPYATYEFANLTCPDLTLTPDLEFIDYEFTNVGGGVDKYEVSIYDQTGTVLIHTDTFVPAFSSPVSGTFTYLTQDTTYRIEVRVFIGTYSKTCTQVVTATTAP